MRGNLPPQWPRRRPRGAARDGDSWICVRPCLEDFLCLLFSHGLLAGLEIGRPQMGGVDDHGCNGAADAIMHAVSEHIILTGGVEVEGAGIGPMPHDVEAVEQRNLMLL